MTSKVEMTGDVLQSAYNETWEQMESVFKWAFNVALTDMLPELTHRFAGEFCEPGGRYQDLMDELLALYEHEFYDESEVEACDMQPKTADAIDAFLNSVAPKSLYNTEILRHFVLDCLFFLQSAQNSIEHADYSYAAFCLCQANLYLGHAAAVVLQRNEGSQRASKASQKRHERWPAVKKEIVEKYHKFIDPSISASEAALQLHAMGVPFHIEGITRIVRAERRQLKEQQA